MVWSFIIHKPSWSCHSTLNSGKQELEPPVANLDPSQAGTGPGGGLHGAGEAERILHRLHQAEEGGKQETSWSPFIVWSFKLKRVVFGILGLNKMVQPSTRCLYVFTSFNLVIYLILKIQDNNEFKKVTQAAFSLAVG